MLPDGLEELAERYTGNRSSLQLATILDYVREHGADTVYVESPYVDFDYRSEYSGLYARSFNPPPDKCERLLFFKCDRFLGFLVARPSVKPVGRTGVAPPPTSDPYLCCRAPHVVRPYGELYEVEAWPFMSQDGVYGVCAHAAIWSIVRYHHLHHRAPQASISAIVAASGTAAAPDKTSPSHGLYIPEVLDAFAGLGLPTLPYNPALSKSGNGFVDIVCRYLNSGFPVALSTPKHLTVLTGYGYENGELFFLRSDDRVGPYERIAPWDGNEDDRAARWDVLLVPVPARLHVRGETAELCAIETLREQGGATKDTTAILGEERDGKLRLRTYAIESADYKAALKGRGLANDVVLHHQLTPASGWVWITEFQRRTASGKRCVIAEVAVDATSHPGDPRPLFANLPCRLVSWLQGENEPRAKTTGQHDLYESAIELRGATG